MTRLATHATRWLTAAIIIGMLAPAGLGGAPPGAADALDALRAAGVEPCATVPGAPVVLSGAVTDGLDPVPGADVLVSPGQDADATRAWADDVVASPSPTDPGAHLDAYPAPGLYALCGARADAEGHYSITLRDGCWTISVIDASGAHRPQTRGVCVSVDHTLDWALERADGSVKYAVTVRDVLSGEPLAGVDVTYTLDPLADVTADTQTTDADGRAVFTLPPGHNGVAGVADGAFRVKGIAGYHDAAHVLAPLAADADALTGAGASRLVDLPLFPLDVAFTASVTDAFDGAALAGATVAVDRDFPPNDHYVTSCATDAAGECVLEVPPALYAVTASLASYSDATAMQDVQGGETVALALARLPVTIEGSVLDWSLSPVAGAGDDAVELTSGAFLARVPVNATGGYSANVPWGEWALRAVVGGYEPAALAAAEYAYLAPPAVHEAQPFRLVAAGTVGLDLNVTEGTVGGPLEGATVTAAGVALGVTPADGLLSVEAPADANEVCAEKARYQVTCVPLGAGAAIDVAVPRAEVPFVGSVVAWNLTPITGDGAAVRVTGTGVNVSATLAEDGTYAGQVPWGAWAVQTEAPHHVNLTLDAVEFPYADEPAPTEVPRFRLVRTGMAGVSLRLHENHTGAPLEGANVTVDGDELPERTDAAGVLLLEVPVPSATVCGFTPLHDEACAALADLEEGGNATLAYPLDRTLTPFNGTVASWTKAPLDLQSGDVVRVSIFNTTLDASLTPQGNYSGSLPWGAWRVETALAAYEPLALEAVDVPLAEGGELTLLPHVRLVSAGTAGVDVVATNSSGPVAGASVRVAGPSAGVTDANGRRAIEVGLDPVEVCVRLAKHHDSCRVIDAEAAGERLEVAFSLTERVMDTNVTGRVAPSRTGSGDLAGATVTLAHNATGRDFTVTASVTGAYRFHVLPVSGEFTLRASKPCYADGESYGVVRANATTALSTLFLPRTTLGEYRVALVDAVSGAPLAHHALELTNATFGLTYVATTGEDGVAVFADLEWAQYVLGGLPATVTARYVEPAAAVIADVACEPASGAMSASPASITLSLERRKLDLTVRFEDAQTSRPLAGGAGGAVRLAPLDGDGAAVECARAAATPTLPQSLGLQPPTPDTWRCAGVAWGNHTLVSDPYPASATAEHPHGYVAAARDVDLACASPTGTDRCANAASTERLDHAAGVLRVTVRDALDGSPVAGARVTVSAAHARYCPPALAEQCAADGGEALHVIALPMSAGDDCFGVAGLVCEAESGADGVAELLLPWGDYAVRVERDGYRAADLSERPASAEAPGVQLEHVPGPGEAAVAVALEPLRVRIQVTVTDANGNPVAGATVSRVGPGAAGPAACESEAGANFNVTDDAGLAGFWCDAPPVVGAADVGLNGGERVRGVPAGAAQAQVYLFAVVSTGGSGAGVALVGPAALAGENATDGAARPTVLRDPLIVVGRARVPSDPADFRGPPLPALVACSLPEGPLACRGDGGTTLVHAATLAPAGKAAGPAGAWAVKPPNVETLPHCAGAAAATECAATYDGPADGAWTVVFAPEAGAAGEYRVHLDVGGASVTIPAGRGAADATQARPEAWVVHLAGGRVAGVLPAGCGLVSLPCLTQHAGIAMRAAQSGGALTTGLLG